MTEPEPQYPEPIQPEDVLPDGEPATCGQSVNIDGTPVECRLSTHRSALLHMGFFQGQPFPWST